LIRTNKIALAFALGVLALVAVAPVASASPAKQGYDETTVLGNVDNGGSAPTETSAPAAETAPAAAETAPVAVESVNTAPAATSESSLPFTGADLGILVLMGILLGGTGLLLRRVVRQRPTV
jgi:predicted secreted protein